MIVGYFVGEKAEFGISGGCKDAKVVAGSCYGNTGGV